MQNIFLDGRSLAELCSLKGRVAVITGASKGIGLACARRLAEGGATLALFDIDLESAREEAAKMAADFGVRCLPFRVDMTDAAGVRAAMEQVYNELGGLQIWVNNAGIFPEIAALDISDENYDRLMALDQRGAFLAARDAARMMLQNKPAGGVIINMVSVSGLIAATNSAHYVAAKHAMTGATKAFARDLAPHGIRVLAIAPTLIATPGVAAGMVDPHGSAALKAFIQQIPMGRAGQPDEVARVVFFAASDLAAFMTGTTLVVDGGELVL
ncbi:MAG: SDR family oxidoreductase [Chitinophagaceae bacterium]|nr:SDR family oxidoreductase [Chitinophagaceae bacterium]